MGPFWGAPASLFVLLPFVRPHHRIIASISSLMVARLKDAAACIGGSSMSDCAAAPTVCCTCTKRQNSRTPATLIVGELKLSLTLDCFAGRRRLGGVR